MDWGKDFRLGDSGGRRGRDVFPGLACSRLSLAQPRAARPAFPPGRQPWLTPSWAAAQPPAAAAATGKAQHEQQVTSSGCRPVGIRWNLQRLPGETRGAARRAVGRLLREPPASPSKCKRDSHADPLNTRENRADRPGSCPRSEAGPAPRAPRPAAAGGPGQRPPRGPALAHAH